MTPLHFDPWHGVLCQVCSAPPRCPLVVPTPADSPSRVLRQRSGPWAQADHDVLAGGHGKAHSSPFKPIQAHYLADFARPEHPASQRVALRCWLVMPVNRITYTRRSRLVPTLTPISGGAAFRRTPTCGHASHLSLLAFRQLAFSVDVPTNPIHGLRLAGYLHQQSCPGEAVGAGLSRRCVWPQIPVTLSRQWLD